MLSSVEAILIRAIHSNSVHTSSLSNVILDTAVSSQTGYGRAVAVEECVCPREYRGLSCEVGTASSRINVRTRASIVMYWCNTKTFDSSTDSM